MPILNVQSGALSASSSAIDSYVHLTLLLTHFTSSLLAVQQSLAGTATVPLVITLWLCSSAGIAGYKTNHSLRATATSRLYHSGVDEQLVMERTGHRSVEGVCSYKRTSDQQREVLSDILNRAPTPKHTASHLPRHSAPTLTQSASQQVLQGLSLPSATFHSCNVNFYIGSNSVLSPTDTNTTPKKRRAMVLYDSDSD